MTADARQPAAAHAADYSCHGGIPRTAAGVGGSGGPASQPAERHRGSQPEAPAVTAVGSFAPGDTKEYLSPQYWDARFEKEDTYEWCKDYCEFRHLVAPELRPSDGILELGCGNSNLGAALAADGFRDVTCTDLSRVVVDRMQQKAAQAGSSVRYQVANMLDLPFAKASFDAVLEKGAFEVFFTDSASAWDPTPAARRSIAKALDEAHRVLRPDGVLISVSFGQPHFRVPLLTACSRHTWNCSVERFGGSFDYFVYVLRKGRRQIVDDSMHQEADAAAATMMVKLGPTVRSRAAEQEAPMHDHMDEETYLMQVTL